MLAQSHTVLDAVLNKVVLYKILFCVVVFVAMWFAHMSWPRNEKFSQKVYLNSGQESESLLFHESCGFGDENHFIG